MLTILLTSVPAGSEYRISPSNVAPIVSPFGAPFGWIADIDDQIVVRTLKRPWVSACPKRLKRELEKRGLVEFSDAIE